MGRRERALAWAAGAWQLLARQPGRQLAVQGPRNGAARAPTGLALGRIRPCSGPPADMAMAAGVVRCGGERGCRCDAGMGRGSRLRAAWAASAERATMLRQTQTIGMR
jgi:hypothetical protein